MSHDQALLQLALDDAARGRSHCCPNPKVGAVIVRNGAILARAYHQGYGLAHAEVNALMTATQSTQGATLYVSLEPCCHTGKTPPCTTAIIKAGIRRVVYAMQDPLQHAPTKGAEVLRTAGVVCDYRPSQAAEDFYRAYNYWAQYRKPWITAKLVVSGDYKIAGKAGKPAKISGIWSDQFVHAQRLATDAILTTVKTVIADDPRFTARDAHGHLITKKKLYILDRQARLPLQAKIFKTTQSITLFHDADLNTESLAQLRAHGVRCVPMDVIDHRLNLAQVIVHIGQDGIHDLWVEVGAECFAELLQQRLLQRVYITRANRLLGKSAYAVLPNQTAFARMLEQEFQLWGCAADQSETIFYRDF